MKNLSHEGFRSVLNSIETPFDSQIIIDGSGSVSPLQFEIMKRFSRLLLSLLGFNDSDTSCRMTLLQFNSQVYTISPFSSNLCSLCNAITSTSQRNGSTNACKALKEGVRIFETEGRKEVGRNIFLFTDGDVCDISSLSSNLKQLGVKLYIIFIGKNIPINFYEKMNYIPESVFSVENFEEIEQIFNNLMIENKEPPQLTIGFRGSKTIKFDITYKDKKFSEFEIYVFDTVLNTTTFLAKTSDLSCYVDETKNLVPGREYKFKCRCKISGNQFTDWSKDLKVKMLVAHKDTALLKNKVWLSQKIIELKNEIINFALDPERNSSNCNKLNILLFSRFGAGKSSFLCSTSSSLEGSYCQTAAAGNGLDHATLEITKYLMYYKNPLIYIWDTFGWSEQNYTNLLPTVLNGRIPNNYKMKDKLDNILANASFEDKVHAVIMFVEASSVRTNSEMEKLKEFFSDLVQAKLTPLVVMTKVDKIFGCDIENRYHEIYEIGVIDTEMENFAKRTGISKNNVFPLVNFTGESSFPNEYMIYFNLNIVCGALRSAKAFIYNNAPKEIINNSASNINVHSNSQETLSSFHSSKSISLNNIPTPANFVIIKNFKNKNSIGKVKISLSNSLEQFRTMLEIKEIPTPKIFKFCNIIGGAILDETKKIESAVDENNTIYFIDASQSSPQTTIIIKDCEDSTKITEITLTSNDLPQNLTVVRGEIDQKKKMPNFLFYDVASQSNITKKQEEDFDWSEISPESNTIYIKFIYN